jgi:hypothetical protein
MADFTSATPPKKKLPFKRTVARRKSPDPFTGSTTKTKKDDDDDDGVDLFRRVEEELPDVLLEQERRIKQKEKRASASAAIKKDLDGQDVKRRKLSINRDPDGDNNESPQKGPVPASASKQKVSTSDVLDDDISMDVKGKEKEITRHSDLFNTKRSGASSSVVNSQALDEHDDDVIVLPSPSTPRNGSSGGRRTRSQRRASPQDEPDLLSNNLGRSPPAATKPSAVDDDGDSDGLEIMDGPPEADEEPDDEFQEYIQRARERAEREAKLKLERASQAQDSQETKSSAGDRSFGVHDEGRAGSAAEDDPVIKLLVTSEIPQTKEKMFERRLNAPLGPVRDAWLGNQNPPVPRDMWPLCFLTWKGNRVYATTTCANLGIRIEQTKHRKDTKAQLGDVAGAEYADKDHGGGLHQGGLHLEAWTEHLYSEYLKKKERERLRLLGQLDDDDDDDAGAAAASGARGSEDPEDGAAGEEVTTRVILKAAKDYEPLRFKVHGHTTIEDMIAIFRDKREVPEDKEISLFFDGEKLDDDMAVRDTEIEDMDSLEVHIK